MASDTRVTAMTSPLMKKIVFALMMATMAAGTLAQAFTG